MVSLRKFIRRRNSIAFAMGVLFCACAVVIQIKDGFSSLSVSTPFEIGKRVLVIDAGHGGIDGGAIGVDGSKESDINLAIARKLYAAATFFGKPAVMTRIDDSRCTDASTYSERKELEYRTELVNSIPNAVLLSIHQNCYPTAQPSGTHVIYSDNGCSEILGTLLQSRISESLDNSSRHLAQPDRNKLYILSNVKCPAALVECGFVSNHFDIGKLTDDTYQTAFASVLLAAFIQYNSDMI